MKIGLLGGTFDPVHNGHLHLAQEALAQEDLDQVIFIPAGNPWMKSDSEISDSEIRKHMIDISIIDNPKFFSNDIELTRSGPTFTSDTLEELVKRHRKNDHFFLILGSDAIKTFHLWNNPERILELTKIILAERKYDVTPTLLKELSRISDISGKIILLKSKMLDISSSEIKRKISAGESIQGQVPNQLQEFISRLKIYR